MGKGPKKTEACPEACRAICCRYVTTKIDAPRTKMDFDELYWFLCHENVEVFIEARKWYVQFDTPCRNLDETSRCLNYRIRPHVCREHSEEECEYWGEEDRKVQMRSPEDLKRYMKRRGVRLRMAWDEPEEEEEKKSPSRSPSRSTRRARTRQPKRAG
jgi:Fe-S-cluster containining protein